MERLSCLVVLFTFFVGSTLAGKSPVLVCHVPLELKIFADEAYRATSANLKPCNEITMSSIHTYFLNQSPLQPYEEIEKRNLQLMRMQTPDASFRFSLRMNPKNPATNLKTLFDGQKAYKGLVDFLRANKLSSFDLAWGLIQSTPNYMTTLNALKTVLNKEGFTLTTTVGIEVDEISDMDLANIASLVDRIHLVPASNSYYNAGRYAPVSRAPEQAFDSLELNEGKFLSLYGMLSLDRSKVVVGTSLQTMVWKSGKNQQPLATLELEPYYESCMRFNGSWKVLPDQPSPFYHLAVSPARDQWMVHVDPVTLNRRINLLRHYGFGGVALYDYHHDDFAGLCNKGGIASPLYPLIQQAGRSIQNTATKEMFPDIDPQEGFCIPFLGLTSWCKGSFNFGTPNKSFTKFIASTTNPLSVITSSSSSEAMSAADGMLEARIAETGAGHHVGLGKLARDPLTSDDDETVITTGNPKPDDLTDNAEASTIGSHPEVTKSSLILVSTEKVSTTLTELGDLKPSASLDGVSPNEMTNDEDLTNLSTLAEQSTVEAVASQQVITNTEEVMSASELSTDSDDPPIKSQEEGFLLVKTTSSPPKPTTTTQSPSDSAVSHQTTSPDLADSSSAVPLVDGGMSEDLLSSEEPLGIDFGSGTQEPGIEVSEPISHPAESETFAPTTMGLDDDLLGSTFTPSHHMEGSGSPEELFEITEDPSTPDLLVFSSGSPQSVPSESTSSELPQSIWMSSTTADSISVSVADVITTATGKPFSSTVLDGTTVTTTFSSLESFVSSGHQTEQNSTGSSTVTPPETHFESSTSIFSTFTSSSSSKQTDDAEQVDGTTESSVQRPVVILSANETSNSLVIQVNVNALLNDEIVIPEGDIKKWFEDLSGSKGHLCRAALKSPLLMSVLCPAKDQLANLINRINRLLPSVIANLTNDVSGENFVTRDPFTNWTTVTPEMLSSPPIFNQTSMKLTELSSNYSIINMTTTFPVTATTLNAMTILQGLLTNVTLSYKNVSQSLFDQLVSSLANGLQIDPETSSQASIDETTNPTVFWKGNVKDSIAAMGRQAGPANIKDISSFIRKFSKAIPSRKPWVLHRSRFSTAAPKVIPLDD